jgi:hypothetical protein
MTARTLSEMAGHERSIMTTLWRKHDPRPSEVAQRLPVFSSRIESLLCCHLAMFNSEVAIISYNSADAFH